jgi:hypothetical protein
MLVDGYVERQKTRRQRDAWLLANLLQPHSKDKLKPAMFLGGDDSQSNKGGGWQKISAEDYKRLLERKRANRR